MDIIKKMTFISSIYSIKITNLINLICIAKEVNNKKKFCRRNIYCKESRSYRHNMHNKKYNLVNLIHIGKDKVLIALFN